MYEVHKETELTGFSGNTGPMRPDTCLDEAVSFIKELEEQEATGKVRILNEHEEALKVDMDEPGLWVAVGPWNKVFAEQIEESVNESLR